MKNRKTLKALSTPSIFHGALENSFNGDRPHCLWRIDNINGRMCILVLSDKQIALTDFSSQFSANNNDFETKEYDTLLNSIVDGCRWRFRITANPTKSIGTEGKRGKIVAHITTNYQKKWLIERSASNGFKINMDEFDVVHSKWYKFYKDNNSCITMLSVTYEGVLEVSNKELFRKALVNGIGREKAYGQGLLTIIKI